FLRAMPDRALDPAGLASHWVAEGDYVCETGWPNMRQTLSVGGWLGLPPTGQKIELRSLDFWHLQDGLIRENWVLVDLMHVYHQLGVDVLERAGEFNKARVI
ncbi:MAG: ester cyclase, partial [Steroidobacteraceae bacterium]